jgi:alpha-beta hydrolase superfamily lysophospholipase
MARSQGPGRPALYEGSWIQLLNASGFAVCGIDTQSCGFSEGVSGIRNYFESFDDLVADVVQFRR